MEVKVLILTAVCLALVNGVPRRYKRQSTRDLLPFWMTRWWPKLISNNNHKVEANAIEPQELLNWPSVPIEFGQISGVSVDQQSNPVILHRGPVVWHGSSFDGQNRYREVSKGPIDVDTIVVLDQKTGVVLNQWGRGLFYMPHGLHVDGAGNIWVTDVALHQVLKFNKGSTEPSLKLGEEFVPGSDASHFCKPTDVAVASNGIFFVADGYCNQRILKFAADGSLIDTYTGSFNTPHSLVLIEDRDLLCVGDRENSRIVCLHAGLKSDGPKFGHAVATSRRGDLSRVYAVASNGHEIFAVTGPSFPFYRAQGFTLDLDGLTVLNKWTPAQGFGNPHDVAVSHDGSSLYAVQIGPNRITKFALN